VRYLLLCLTALFMTSAALAADGQSTLTVVMSGFKNDAGLALVSVFRGPDGFPFDTEKSVRKAKVAIKDGKAVAVFPALVHGTYAVACFHDEDLSGKLERNVLGIPRKGYGLSNSPPGFPAFSKSAFSLDGPDKTIEMPIKY